MSNLAMSGKLLRHQGKTLSFQPLKIVPFTDNIVIPTINNVPDLTNAEYGVRVTLGGKELFPNFNESIGSRNLLLDSGISVTNSSYPIMRRYLSDAMLVNNEMVSMLGMITFDFSKNKFGAYNSGGTYGVFDIPVTNIENEIIQRSNKWRGGDGQSSNNCMFFYALPRDDDNPIKNTISWVKLVRGNEIPEYWTPAPEEVLSLSTLDCHNCFAVAIDDKIKITTITPETKSGYIDVTTTYGEKFTARKRLNWRIER